MPKRLWRQITSPTARIIGSLWIIVGLVSGLVISTSIREESCDQQFRSALVERARINDQADKLDQLQRQALADWIHDFSSPPPGADVYGADRLAWLATVSVRAMERFNQLKTAHDDAVAERAKHPIPELTCGT
jgi:hypothetical protein